jgi:hypothetical protein
MMLALTLGCGGTEDRWTAKRPKTVPAAGIVTQKGKPLSRVLVMCRPEGGDQGCSGMSDENGYFELMTFNPDPGAVPGKYLVAVQSSQQPEEYAEDVPRAKGEKFIKPTPPLPTKFAIFETSGLTIEIPAAGSKELKVDLPE